MSDERQGLPSASRTDQWVNCPGSHLAQAQFPDDEPNEAAQRGIRIHSHLAGEAIELDADEKELSTQLREMEGLLVARWLEANQVSGVLSTREQRLKLRNDQKKILCTGKPDVVYIGQASGKTIGLIVDYKTGEGIVSTQGNYQLQTLGVMVRQEYKAEEVSYGILQRGSPLEIGTMADLDLRVWEQKLFIALERALEPTAKRIAGSWCRYCKAVGACPEAAEQTKTLALRGETLLLDISQVPALLDACLAAEGVIEKVREKAKALLRQGAEIPGWKLQEEQRRSVDSEADAIERVMTSLGRQEAMNCFSFSLTALERTLSKNLPKKEARAKAESLLDGLISRKQITKLMRVK